ncbi:Predicted E3 ubiquitin ligase [Ceraceosorus bombacis]|uniref:RING-type E3 ubiquitin transferase n=1 Tax=Ceraceosorus bombacis TaxID=401625 RepID=A0A0N7L8Z8_9BASI|nr:Predicted E3 ubiquitin ligase [Ceraceosorus bombacis]
MSSRRALRKRSVALAALALVLTQQHALAHATSSNGASTSATFKSATSSSSSFASRFSSAILRGAGRWMEIMFPSDPSYLPSFVHGSFESTFHLPTDDENATPGGGLFGDGDTTFAWGGSTLEVVKTQARYVTRPAAFGPHITADEGQRGSLLPISDFYIKPAAQAAKEPWNADVACPYRGGPGWKEGEDGTDLGRLSDSDDSDLAVQGVAVINASPATSVRPPSDWVALVERGGGCSFAAKVRVSQALGAKAVVVGDAPSASWRPSPGGSDADDPGLAGRLLTMFAPGDTSDIRIPSTFITRPTYVDLRRLVEELAREQHKKREWCLKHADQCHAPEGDKGPRSKGLDIILGRDDIMWEWPLIDLALMLLLLPSFMTILTVIVHRIRLARQRKKDRAPEVVVLSLPCLIWRANGQPWEKVEENDSDLPIANAAPGQASASASSSAAAAPSLVSPPTSARQTDEEAGPSDPARTTVVTPLAERAQASASAAASAPNPSHAHLPPGRSYYSCDECAICLDNFVDGDQVRVLPCGHIFHRSEIDDWLVRIRKVCPICKRDVTVPVPPAPPAGSVVASPSIDPTQGTAQETPALATQPFIDASSAPEQRPSSATPGALSVPTESTPLLGSSAQPEARS